MSITKKQKECFHEYKMVADGIESCIECKLVLARLSKDRTQWMT